MKKVITLKSLTLLNFKGIKSLHLDLENQTDIYGANGTGKTTIADAVNWLWFGKDSSDRKDFEIKTLDVLGKVIPMIEHEVSAVYDIDGNIVTMKRILKENWVKKRGAETQEFSGNVTECYWNDVPMTITDFNKKVETVCTEAVLKPITSTSYFTGLDWKSQRGFLIGMVGDVSDEEIAAGNPAYLALLSNLTQGKTIDEYKLQISNSIKKAKDDLKAIPTRIDEVNRQKPEAQDFVAIQKELAVNESQLSKVNEQIADSSKAFDAQLEAQKELKININNVAVEITNIESGARTEARERLTPDTSALDRFTRDLQKNQSELTSYSGTIATLEQKQNNIKSEIKSTEDKMTAKRSEWGTENAKELVFDDANFCCPTCERAFDASDIESKKSEMISTFKLAKTKKLNEITAEGQRLKTYKESLESELAPIASYIETNKGFIAETEREIERIKAEISSLNNVSASDLPSEESVYESVLSLHPTYKTKVDELKTLQSQLVEIPQVNNEELVTKRNGIVNQIDNLKGQLNLKAQIDTCDARIKELREEESKLSQQILNVEKEQFTIENFIKDKIYRLETAINEKFKMVNFKMFDVQINQGIKETCVAMVNGVPFTDLNTASKINAGLDIINTLCDFYGVSAPIFIDNAESVHTLIDTDSQLVRLVVSEQHKQLTVSNISTESRRKAEKQIKELSA